ncbi:dipeptidase [Anaerobacillus isosaccharinicus]|uniref:Dipeptidase n=1 Tax=Anaerobacillus isosaccharinicus TaxID=1532552 RepID=A0A7S7RBB6_9BACI|nr:dipeptidase [Anaerobacillus isosaccharinicus]MBA5586001.1 membrane dipeptidase [Anaerobacillus isosaccharinicus]QOY35721.1 dipeptidase [Anaerobacillus isosaccharinicus]
MKIIDTHCDALLKLLENKNRSFTNSPDIETNFDRLSEGGVTGQLFAIFIEPEVPSDEKYSIALQQIELFHSEVVGKHEKIKKIEKWSDFEALKDGEIGAVLTLEGADAFGNDMNKLKNLYSLGVKSLGLTWNNANLVGDGLGESRGAGLTDFGKEVVKLNNEHKVLTDVSHLSVKGFWDVMDLALYPIATHSNSIELCSHRRNLSDEQAKAMFGKNGLVGIVFNPPFLTETGTASITDIVRHIEHFCSIGGEKRICLGSDFDGISQFVKGLEDSSKYQQLINELLKHYTQEQVAGFAHKNFLNFIPRA